MGLYDEASGKLWGLLDQGSGVTQVQFGADENYLYTGGRRDGRVLCWDVRNMSGAIFTAERASDTNQKIQFDLDSTGRYLVSGGQDGVVKVFDSKRATTAFASSTSNAAGGAGAGNGSGGAAPKHGSATDGFAMGEALMHDYSFVAERDAVNGVSLHPWLALLATSSGQRHFAPRGFDSDGAQSDQSSSSDGDSERDDDDVHGDGAGAGAGGSSGAGARRAAGSANANISSKRRKVSSTSKPSAQKRPRKGKSGVVRKDNQSPPGNSIKVWRPSLPRDE